MIGKAKACKGGGALFQYVKQDNKGYELDRNLVSSDTSKGIMEEMRPIQELNQNAENRTLSLVLSPAPDEAQKLSNDQLRQMAKEFMQELGIDPKKQQYYAFVHTEKRHKHIHIIANRVKENGTLIPDHFIGKRAQHAAHRVAKRHGLTSAKEKQIENLKSLQQQKEVDKLIKQDIIKTHRFVMRRNPHSLENYRRMMKEMGVDFKPVENLNGKLQGHRIIDLKTGKDFKASDVHRSLSLQNLMKQGLPLEKTKDILPTKLIPVQKLALKIAKKLIKQLARTEGIGY